MINHEKKTLQLPFTDSPIQSSSKVSFAYSILKANMGDDFDKFLSHKFVSYFYDKDMDTERFSFSRDDLWGTREKITIVQDVDLLKETYAELYFDIAHFVSTCIKSGIYVHGKCDRSMFEKSFVNSENAVDYYLITGYNPFKKTFLVRYFDIDLCCQCCEIDYETFYTSAFSIPFERVKFYLIKFCDHREYEVNINSIIAAFEAYVQSVESKLIRIHNRVYGLEATSALQKHIQTSITKGNEVDQSYLLCFAEHKDLMLWRVTYLVKNNFLPPQLLKGATTVSEIKDHLLELLNHYNLTLEKNSETEIIELIDQINIIEKDHLHSLIKKLKKNLHT